MPTAVELSIAEINETGILMKVKTFNDEVLAERITVNEVVARTDWRVVSVRHPTETPTFAVAGVNVLISDVAETKAKMKALWEEYYSAVGDRFKVLDGPDSPIKALESELHARKFLALIAIKVTLGVWPYMLQDVLG